MPEPNDTTRWIDDREHDEQQTLDVGRECLATADREPHVAGSADFADDSDGPADAGEQSRVASAELPGQADLDGEPARRPTEWERDR